MLNFFDHNFVCSGRNSGCPTWRTSFKEVSFTNRRPITLATPFVVHSKWNFVIRISSSFSLSETHQQQEKKNWWNWILCLHFLRCSLEFFFLFSFPCINKHTSDWMRFARSFSFLRLASFLIAKKKPRELRTSSDFWCFSEAMKFHSNSQKCLFLFSDPDSKIQMNDDHHTQDEGAMKRNYEKISVAYMAKLTYCDFSFIDGFAV